MKIQQNGLVYKYNEIIFFEIIPLSPVVKIKSLEKAPGMEVMYSSINLTNHDKKFQFPPLATKDL